MRTTVPDRSAALMVRPGPYTVFPASVRLIATPLPTPRLAPVTSDLHGNECSSAPDSAGSFVPQTLASPRGGTRHAECVRHVIIRAEGPSTGPRSAHGGRGRRLPSRREPPERLPQSRGSPGPDRKSVLQG